MQIPRAAARQVSLSLKFLTPEQVTQLDELLAGLGDYGEIQLIVQKRELRYINKTESFRAWKEALARK